MSLPSLPTLNHGFNRQSVQSAIKSTQQLLKLYNKLPPNGVAVFCGLASSSDVNKERLVTLDVAPLRPIKRIIYHCGNRFYIDPIKELLVDETDERYGVIVVDGKSAVFGVLQGSTRHVLGEFSVALPNKHSRGGQSQNRFARLREEKVHEYLKKVAETAAKHFLSQHVPNVVGLILAGSAGLKDDLRKHSRFDKRLNKIVLQSVDVAYGGRRGFAQAIEESLETIGNQKLLHEKRVLEEFFEHMTRDTGRYCFSAENTTQALEMGAVKALIVSEGLDLDRCELDDGSVHFCQKSQASLFSGVVAKRESLFEWFCENYQSFGCQLEIVSDQTGVGKQFFEGFGGLGGLLRWEVAALKGGFAEDVNGASSFGYVDVDDSESNSDNGGEHLDDESTF